MCGTECAYAPTGGEWRVCTVCGTECARVGTAGGWRCARCAAAARSVCTPSAKTSASTRPLSAPLLSSVSGSPDTLSCLVHLKPQAVLFFSFFPLFLLLLIWCLGGAERAAGATARTGSAGSAAGSAQPRRRSSACS
eukprot:1076356-Rhodomonas_salina.1